jgi:DMSO/TMAO reductase YedYZ molybdopterin-dependent catalytic subunit
MISLYNSSITVSRWCEMKKIILAAVAFLTVVSFGGTALTACSLEGSDEPEELGPVEIREYQGERLSSVNDFRENSIRGPQYIDMDSYTLQISGLVDEPKSYTYDEVISSNDNYTKLVTLSCVEGWSVDILWEGVLVKDLLEKSGISPEAKTVIFYAYDEYSTSLPLDFVLDNNIMLAYRMNDITIPPERGFPFQLVAEDKWGYKWIKWVTAIELSEEDYIGYWESRGYSNDGSLDESFFDPGY